MDKIDENDFPTRIFGKLPINKDGMIELSFEGCVKSYQQECYEKLVEIYTKRGDKELADVFKKLVEIEERKVF